MRKKCAGLNLMRFDIDIDIDIDIDTDFDFRLWTLDKRKIWKN